MADEVVNTETPEVPSFPLKPETVEKLRQLEQFILAESGRFNLTLWGVHIDPQVANMDVDDLYERLNYDVDFNKLEDEILPVLPPCGSVGCLAGSTLMMAGIVKPGRGVEDKLVYIFDDSTPDLAEDYLGITKEQGKNLFFLREWGWEFGWPRQFEQRLSIETPGTKEYAQVAVDRIEHFIATGE